MFSLRFLCVIWTNLKHQTVVPLLRRLVAGLSSLSPGFDPEEVRVRFVIDKLALGQSFAEYFGFPLSASFHQQVLHTQLRRGTAFTTGTSGRRLGAFKQSNAALGVRGQ
jgi:hypothetical protein